MTESLTEKQVRLVLEKQCRDLSEEIKKRAPAGTGFILFLADIGDVGGNFAYISTIVRDDAHKLVQDWLDYEDANHPKEGWETAALIVQEVAAASGFEGDPEPEQLFAHLRALATKGKR